MRPIGASAITLAGIALLWFAATRPLITDAEPAAGLAPVSTDLDVTIEGVVHLEPPRGERASKRDAFGYVEPPPAPVAVVPAPPAEPEAPPLIVAAQPAEEPPPRLEYRYIGRFGRERDPIVAFAGNGEVLTVRPGDRVGDRFILRSIGLESVEVVDARGRIVRVRLGE